MAWDKPVPVRTSKNDLFVDVSEYGYRCNAGHPIFIAAVKEYVLKQRAHAPLGDAQRFSVEAKIINQHLTEFIEFYEPKAKCLFMVNLGEALMVISTVTGHTFMTCVTQAGAEIICRAPSGRTKVVSEHYNSIKDANFEVMKVARDLIERAYSNGLSTENKAYTA